MDHLTVDEIIDFVSLTEATEDSDELVTTVNKHICQCPECLKLVQAFQDIYDEFHLMNLEAEFRSYIALYQKNKADADKKPAHSEDYDGER